MNYKNSIDRLKKEIAEFKPEPAVLEWLKKELTARNKHWEKLPPGEAEFFLLSRVQELLEDIIEEKPTDIRAYVEKQLKEEEYDERLSRIGKEIFGIRVGDVKAADAMQKKLRQFIEKTDKEMPGFGTSRGRMMSEMYGDILAIRTKGRVGSMRMILRISEGQDKQKEKKRSSRRQGK